MDLQTNSPEERNLHCWSVMFVIVILSASLFPLALTDSTALAASCTPSVSPFTVSGVSWAGSPQGAGPGSSNVQLVVSLVYSGGCPVTYAQFQLGLRQPFSSATGQNSSESAYQVNLLPYEQFQVVYPLDVASNATTGNYQLPMTISFNLENVTGFSESTSVTVPLLGSVQLLLGTYTPTLNPGQVNNVTLFVYNLGSGNASNVQVGLAQPSQGVSLIGQLPTFPIVGSGKTVPFPVQVYVSSSLQGQPVTLAFTISQVNAYGAQSVQQSSVGFYVKSNTAFSSGAPISVSTVTPDVFIGQSSMLQISIRNTGATPIRSPTFTLSVPSGFAVVSNSTFSAQGYVIPPGRSFLFTACVITGPKTPEGAYSGQLVVSYVDSLGNYQTTTVPIGFLAVGKIVLSAQAVTFSESGGVLTVSGTLLNEGTSSAFYLQMNASVTQNGNSLGQGSGYVGEVDPNTPIPFSVQVPLSVTAVNGTASVTLGANYLNDYEQSLNATLPVETFQLVLSHSSETSTGSGGGTSFRTGREFFLFSVLVLSIGVVMVVVALVVSRRRGGSRNSESYPAQDKKVI